MWDKDLKLSYHDSTSQRWTKTAVDCYERKFKCNGCFYYENYFRNAKYKCQMKATVMELVRKFGRPKIDKELTRD